MEVQVAGLTHEDAAVGLLGLVVGLTGVVVGPPQGWVVGFEGVVVGWPHPGLVVVGHHGEQILPQHQQKVRLTFEALVAVAAAAPVDVAWALSIVLV